MLRTNFNDFRRPGNRSSGFTVLELVATLAIVGILSGMATYQIRELDNPAENAASQVITFLKTSRAKALASTNAYRVTPLADGRGLETQFASSCSAPAFTPDPALVLDFPNTASVDDTSWSLCFSPRGTLLTSTRIEISDPAHDVTVQVAMGGGMRKL